MSCGVSFAKTWGEKPTPVLPSPIPNPSKRRKKRGRSTVLDGGKKVKGRKRHIVVDSQGFVLGVLVTEANAPERLGAVVVFDEARDKLSRLEVVYVDQGYSGGELARAIRQVCGDSVRVEVIKRSSKDL